MTARDVGNRLIDLGTGEFGAVFLWGRYNAAGKAKGQRIKERLWEQVGRPVA